MRYCRLSGGERSAADFLVATDDGTVYHLTVASPDLVSFTLTEDDEVIIEIDRIGRVLNDTITV